MPMCTKIGPEYLCFKGKDKNSNVHKDRARIPTIEVEGKDKNFNVYDNTARVPVFRRMRSKFQCL